MYICTYAYLMSISYIYSFEYFSKINILVFCKILIIKSKYAQIIDVNFIIYDDLQWTNYTTVLICI